MLQRISALYLAAYLFYLIVHFLLQDGVTWQQWHAWLTHPVMRIASAGFILALLAHSWIGMRDIILDYIHVLGLRLLLLALIGLVLAACGLWALQIILLAAGPANGY